MILRFTGQINANIYFQDKEQLTNKIVNFIFDIKSSCGRAVKALD